MQPSWRPLITDFDVKARPEGIWTLVLDFVGPSRKLKFRATGKWSWEDPAAGAPPPTTTTAGPAPMATAAPQAGGPGKRECGPDGDFTNPAGADALTQDASIGALIGKIGGSSASVKNTGAFVVGSYCVLDVNDTTKGPLYLTINDVPAGMGNNSGSVKVSIWEAL